ncbi:MAG: HD domain-containing protein [Actinobacteria bacterium]|nr:HD domain-containing protein [Actinomycetota bacterium]
MNEQGQLIGDETVPGGDTGGDTGGNAGGRVAVRDLAAGQVDSVFRLDQSSQHNTKAGKPYLRLTFGDATGAVPGVMWDDVTEVVDICKTGAVLAVQGRYEVSDRYGPQLTVRSMRPAEAGEYDAADLEEVPLFAYDELESGFTELVASVRQAHLAELLARLLGPETATGRAFMQMPAAKKNHQAYEHGLLEHTLTVAQAVSAAADVFPGLDRDLAVTGALLHDIGKLDAYAQTEGGIDITDDGKLQSEIPLGYYRIKREIEEIDGFDPTLAQALLHIQLSHHGKLEHGSPVEPATREAVLVSMMDHLGGTLGTYDRLEKGLPAGIEWSPFDRAVGDKGGSAFFGHSPGIRR